MNTDTDTETAIKDLVRAFWRFGLACAVLGVAVAALVAVIVWLS